MLRSSLQRIAIVALFCAHVCTPSLDAAARPNVIVILADDLGFADLGCTGGEIATPNLDRLAANGILFTQFYNTAKCAQTRTSLLSGRYYPELRGDAFRACSILPEAFGEAGYTTLMTGKWHLQGHPMDHGFERYFGHLSGATNFFHGDGSFYHDREKYEVPKEGFYTTDANIDYALRFLDTAPKDRPFFLYLAFNAPHYPLQTKEADYRKYETRYRRGWDVLRRERYERQLAMGLFPKRWPLPPRPADVPSWDSQSAQEKAEHALTMAAFAGMVDCLDQNVGRLVDRLERDGTLDDTLILFLSDNGACPFQRTKPPTRAGKLQPWDPRSYWTYDKRWAHAGNTPFRYYKQNQHEGGITTPLIAHWPKGIARVGGSANRSAGRKEHRSAHLVDLFPTVLEAAGVTPQRIAKYDTPGPLRGKSFLPIFRGQPWTPRHETWFLFSRYKALRQGDWKAVSLGGESGELYDLAKDRTELTDLAKQEPERLARMTARWSQLTTELGGATKKRDAGRAQRGKKKRKGKAQPEKKRDAAGKKQRTVSFREAPKRRPNVVLIVADDLGYADMSFLKHAPHDTREMGTPGLDRLAAMGTYFTDAYATAPICSPSRCGLLTGRYQQRWGNYWYGEGGLPASETTLPRALGEFGYATKKIGKSHLNGGPVRHPLDHGFDAFLGFIGHTKDYLRLSADDVEAYGAANARAAHIGPLTRNRELVSYDKSYTTDIFTDEAVRFIRQRKNRDEPFYLHVSHNAVHHPTYVCHPDYLGKFGIEQFPFWDPKKEPYRTWHRKWGHLDAVDPDGRKRYLLQLHLLDRGVAGILDALEETGQRDDTIVVFLSDNGGTINTYSNNAPLSGWKYMFAEGGLRIPMIVAWPGRLPAKKTCSALVSAMDVFPTIVELVGGAIPDDLDGRSLVPVLKGDAQKLPREFLCWSNGRGAEVIRKGRWKLCRGAGWQHSSFEIVDDRCVRDPDGYAYPGGTVLFDLHEDIGETSDVAAAHPEVVAELTERWASWRRGMSDPRTSDGKLKGKRKQKQRAARR